MNKLTFRTSVGLAFTLAAVGLGLSVATPPVKAQATGTNDGASCILAGRLDSEAKWAPQFKNLDLLDAEGKLLTPKIGSSAKDSLGQVKQVRVKAPALLADCNGSLSLAKGDASAGGKSDQANAVSAGQALIAVQSIAFPPLGIGGELVELKLALNADRMTSIPRR